MENKEFKKTRELIIDIVFLVVLAALSGAVLYYLYSYLPLSKFYLVAGILGAIFLVFLLAMFIKTRSLKILWAKRAVIILLCLALGAGTYYIGISDLALRELDGQSDKIEILVVSKKSSPLKSESDLSGKTVGIQTLTHTNITTYAQDELKKQNVSNIKYTEDLDYESLYKDLQAGKMDAIIIPRVDLNTMRSTQTTIDDDIKIISRIEMDATTATSVASDVDITKEVFTVLISGMDSGEDINTNGLSDTNILLIIDPIGKHVEMISIPRDSFIPNPQLGYGNDKLTHLAAYGISNLEEGIELALNIDIDFYAKLNFLTAVELIDIIGGVDVDIPIAFCEQDEYRRFGEYEMCFEPGQQHVNGSQAVAFARHRKSYTDIDRGKAQQQIIAAALSKVTSVSGIAKVPELLKKLPETVSTNVPYESIKAFAANEIETVGSIGWTVNSLNFDNWDSDMRPTASAPGMDASVTILDKGDAARIYNVYYAMKHPTAMNSFNFDVNNLEANQQPFTSYPTMIWVGGGQYVAPQTPVQQAPVQQAPVQQAPVQQQPVQEAPVEQPQVPQPEPEQPPVPEQPQTEVPAEQTQEVPAN